jgi:ABC-type arginine transport system permease subunit
MEQTTGTLLSWGPEGWSDDMAWGVLVTVTLALATLPIGLLIGFFVALAKQCCRPIRARFSCRHSAPFRTASMKADTPLG